MVIGKVTKIKVGGRFSDSLGEFGFVYLDGSLYYMWWSAVWPEEMAPNDRLKYSMWLSMLKDAVANDWNVELMMDNDSTSKVVTVVTPV